MLVIVFKIVILIYNTQMNSILRQFMSTRFQWTPVNCDKKHYNKIIRLQNSSRILVDSIRKVVEFYWNPWGTGKTSKCVM